MEGGNSEVPTFPSRMTREGLSQDKDHVITQGTPWLWAGLWVAEASLMTNRMNHDSAVTSPGSPYKDSVGLSCLYLHRYEGSLTTSPKAPLTCTQRYAWWKLEEGEEAWSTVAPETLNQESRILFIGKFPAHPLTTGRERAYEITCDRK